MPANQKRAPMVEDFNNLLYAMEPNGVERQERHEQAALVSSNCQLPREVNSGVARGVTAAEVYAKLGIAVLEAGDDDQLFYTVRLPDGWKIRATDHAMWSDLLDNRGRIRLSIFYKGAFYDRSAHVDVVSRFYVGAEPVVGYNTPEYENLRATSKDMACSYFVFDCKKRVYAGPEFMRVSVYPKDYDFAAQDRVEEASKQVCVAWLDEKYPNWRDPYAYWE